MTSSATTVFLATGAGLPAFGNPGENYNGVYSANGSSR